MWAVCVCSIMWAGVGPLCVKCLRTRGVWNLCSRGLCVCVQPVFKMHVCVFCVCVVCMCVCVCILCVCVCVCVWEEGSFRACAQPEFKSDGQTVLDTQRGGREGEGLCTTMLRNACVHKKCQPVSTFLL